MIMDSARKQRWAAADGPWQGRKDRHRVLEDTCLNVGVYACIMMYVCVSRCECMRERRACEGMWAGEYM